MGGGRQWEGGVGGRGEGCIGSITQMEALRGRRFPDRRGGRPGLAGGTSGADSPCTRRPRWTGWVGLAGRAEALRRCRLTGRGSLLEVEVWPVAPGWRGEGASWEALGALEGLGGAPEGCASTGAGWQASERWGVKRLCGHRERSGRVADVKTLEEGDCGDQRRTWSGGAGIGSVGSM